MSVPPADWKRDVRRSASWATWAEIRPNDALDPDVDLRTLVPATIGG